MSKERRHTRTVIFPGMATHWRPNNSPVSACGIVTPKYYAYDPRDADCFRCERTARWRTAMGKKPND